MSETTLYWIGTPRHFLIAAGLALDAADTSDAHLLLTSRQGYVAGIVDVIESWEQSPFSHIQVIQGPLVKNQIAQRLHTAKMIRRFRKFARVSRFTQVCVFPATTHEAQAFLYETKQSSPKTRRTMIEDGGIYYNSQSIGTASYAKWKLLAGRALYGPAWAVVNGQGIGEVVDEIQLISPQHVRKEWSSCNLVKLSPRCLLRLADSELPDVYLRMAGLRVEELGGIEVLVILSRSDGITGDLGRYVDVVDGLLEVARKYRLKAAVKYHPKEPLSDYMRLDSKPWVLEVPRELPGELLFLVNSKTLDYVLGDTSTALISASWLLPKCKPISFVGMVNKHADLVYPDFQGLGVSLIDGVRDFEGMLCNR